MNQWPEHRTPPSSEIADPAQLHVHAPGDDLTEEAEVLAKKTPKQWDRAAWLSAYPRLHQRVWRRTYNFIEWWVLRPLWAVLAPAITFFMAFAGWSPEKGLPPGTMDAVFISGIWLAVMIWAFLRFSG